MFCHELDVLRIRLEELAKVVDRFVLVESPVTLSGKTKPLYYHENRSRFADFAERIDAMIVDDMPTTSDSWAREHFQRNAIRRGLTDCQPDDVIMISDADEIPRATCVARYTPEEGPSCFDQQMCYYWLNCCCGRWRGTRILSFRQFNDFPNATAIRYHDCRAISDGGWHFSYLGGVPAIQNKIGWFAHVELDHDRFTDSFHIEFARATGVDVFGRPEYQWSFVPLDESFPKCVHDFPERFRHLWADAAFHEDWYFPSQLTHLAQLVGEVRGLTGRILEIGCWEGRSTIALARACEPETLLAVDTWEGSFAEGDEHPTVMIARKQDVFLQFKKNVAALTCGNVCPIRRDCFDFLMKFDEPIKFAHVDASHDYPSVRRTLELLRPRVVPGGILVGEDFESAHEGRADLQGGVARAVRELLPGFVQRGNLWYWQNF